MNEGFIYLTFNILINIENLKTSIAPSITSSITEKYSLYFDDIDKKTYDKYKSNTIEKYFIDPSYIKQNKILKSIYFILIETIKIIFCENIKKTIKETIKKTLKSSNEIIEYIMTNTDKNNKSLDDIINELPVPLIRTYLKIYEDKYDKDTYTSSSIKDILNNIFDQLYNYENIIGKELIDNMKLYYVNYYETLIIKILPLLLVNCENILKFFIVLNRLKEIKQILENK